MIQGSGFNLHEASSTVDEQNWNELVLGCPDATPYHLWEYGTALCSAYNYQRHYLVLSDNKAAVGVLPLILLRSRLFKDRLISLPFCEYGGPLLRTGIQEGTVALDCLIRGAKALAGELDAAYIEFRSPPNPTGLSTRLPCAPKSRYCTFEVDLSEGEDAIWRLLPKRTRNAISRGYRNGLVVSAVATERDLDDYFDLYLRTQKRLGSPPHSLRFFMNLCGMSGNTRFFLASNDAGPVAGAIMFFDGQKMYWWNSVADPAFRYLNGTSVILWSAMKWGAQSGLRGFVLGRTRDGSGVYRFKQGWGGTRMDYFDYVYSPREKSVRLPDPEQNLYRVASRVWSLLPRALASKLGPAVISQIGL